MINYPKIWSYKKVKIIAAIFSLIIIYSLYSAIDYKISRMILEDVKLKSQNDSLTIRLKEMMQDSVMNWHKSNRRFFTNYNISEDWYWEDVIVFNREKTKAYSFIYQIDKDKNYHGCDGVKYYLAFKKKNGNWYFYTDTPYLCIGRGESYYKPPYTKEKIQDLMYEDLSKYVSIFSWCVDDDIVEDWFESEGGGAILRDAMKEN